MRIVTWNLWWRFGPWQERRKAILAVLRELDPDVVGLQEVWDAGGENLAVWLAGELDLHCAWAPSPDPGRWQRRIGDDGVGIGNAVLSRWPVRERAVLRLPAPPELDDGRLALYARLDAPGRPVPFFTAHLTSQVHASAVRCEQVRALARFVDAHRRAPPSRPSSPVTSTPGRTPTRSVSSAATGPRPPCPAWSCSTPGSTPIRRPRP